MAGTYACFFNLECMFVQFKAVHTFYEPQTLIKPSRLIPTVYFVKALSMFSFRMRLERES